MQPLLGFKIFKVDPIHSDLMCLHAPARWKKKGPTGSYCFAEQLDFKRLDEPHRGGDPRCTCGLYADWRPRFQPDLAEMLTAAVIGWGLYSIHDLDGWRSEYARIVALGRPREFKNCIAAAEEVASAYGVPLIAPEHLEDYALEYGERPRIVEMMRREEARTWWDVRKPWAAAS